MQRKSLAALALALGATACGAAIAQGRAHVPQPTPVALAPKPPKAPKPKALHRATPDGPTLRRSGYRVTSTEAHPAVKRLAEQVALALTNYPAGTTASAIAATLTRDAAARSSLAEAMQPLMHPQGSTGDIIYPQMGGFTPDAASVMVVTRQQFSRDGTTVTETRTLDIRLARSGDTWNFVQLASAGGTPVPRPQQLSAIAAAVVDNPHITMPDSARWDIYRGVISPVLLELMARIADHYSYAVTVLETGHPLDVFGTDHRSMHSFGRAVDINLVDGTHVIDQRHTGSRADDLVHWLLAQPVVAQVGSPWDYDGSGARSFTNDVHLDHVHVSV